MSDMNRDKIGLIGHFAKGHSFFDGQTVSTRLLERQLKLKTNNKVICVDTYNFKKNFLHLLKSTISCMKQSSNVIFMVSNNGLKVFIPLLYYFSRVYKTKIYHRVIGGRLDDFIVKNPRYIVWLNDFEVNWVQTPDLKEKLERLGLNNVELLENFRDAQPVDEGEISRRIPDIIKFCTFSRVSKVKGIDLAINAIKSVTQMRGNETIELHIYGPIEKEYEEEFFSSIKDFDNIKYCGAVDSEEAVNTLKQYYMHLFPTTWAGEGFPGTIIDCYNAGLPTIASNWAYNTDFVEDKYNGYIYDWERPEQLLEKIIESLEHKSLNYEMRINCLKKAKQYSPDIVMKKILLKIGIQE